MKKFVSALLVLTMVFSFFGCAKNNGTQPSDEQQNVTEEQTQGATVTTQAETVVKEKAVRVPATEIYFSCPTDWNVAETIRTQVVSKSEEALVGVFSSASTPVEGDLIQMVSAYSAMFLRDVSSYSKGYLRTSEIEVVESKKDRLGNYDCAVFNGKVNNDGEWDCHVYGYALTVDGVNLMILGLVSAKAQDADMISEIDALTDQIAKSIRTEK